jgi:two-component system, cell cycle sensor histidine kinase and response regulator CckA
MADFPPIRILHLEDNPRDAELIAAKLELDGISAEIFHVSDWDTYTRALETEFHDLILCDYNLPGADGVTALETARKLQPHTPVIMISGSIGEEEAVRCLQLGATDYLIKERMERLVPAVLRALEESQERHQRRRAEKRLRDSESRFRQFAEHSTDAVWLVELNPERIVYVSPAVERIWGLTPAQFAESARVWLAAVHPDDRQIVSDHWESAVRGECPSTEIEYRVFRPDGSLRWVLHSSTPILDTGGAIDRIGGTAKDITERRQMEERMLRTQRLESIGTLAGGIAHDLNNTLVPIMMATGLLRVRAPAQNDLIDSIESAAQRAAAMVRQLLTFAKGIEGARLLVRPEHLLAEIEKLIKSTFPKSIELRTSYTRNLPPLLGDATQLHQVLLNLCVNARDAMPNGGALTVEAESIEISENFTNAFAEAKPGRYVVWHITDTGVGIEPDMVDRIFDPFFTTKGGSGGTGLGLSTVSGIVKSHGGFIQVYSTPGQGSTFSVHLPAAESESGEPLSDSEAETLFRGSGETILVLDDDAEVRTVMRSALTALNFKVIACGDGMEALHQVGERRHQLAAVITDFNMPRMDGLTFVEILKRMHPEAKVIVTSGRLDEQATREFKNLGVDALLDKPFTQQRLASVLRKVLQPAT